MHAKCDGHSEFATHSGLQYGGVPTYSGKHEQEGVSPLARHSAFGPQGDGRHGSCGNGKCCGGSIIC